MSKHTAGPWVYDGFAGGFILASDNNTYLFQSVFEDEDGFFIEDENERDANGRLAAVAPELLEALEAQDTFWDNRENELGVLSDEAYAIWHTIKDVIAKAKGKQP